MKDKFIKTLLRLAREGTGCSIQHNRCPCNTCFHTWAEDELGLSPRLGHALWLIVLSLRGDYDGQSLDDAIKKL